MQKDHERPFTTGTQCVFMALVVVSGRRLLGGGGGSLGKRWSCRLGCSRWLSCKEWHEWCGWRCAREIAPLRPIRRRSALRISCMSRAFSPFVTGSRHTYSAPSLVHKRSNLSPVRGQVEGELHHRDAKSGGRFWGRCYPDGAETTLPQRVSAQPLASLPLATSRNEPPMSTKMSNL